MSIETIAYALCIENATAFGGKVFKLYCAGLKKLKDDAVPYAFTGQGELFSFKAAGKVYVPYRTGSVHWGYAPQGIRPTEADRYRFEAVNGEAVAVVANLESGGVALNGTAFGSSRCFQTTPADSDWLTETGRTQLSAQLKALAANDTEITLKECDKTTSHTVTASSTTATPNQKAIQIEVCWDGQKFSIASHRFEDGALQVPSGYTGTVAEVLALSDAAVAKVKEKGIAATQSDDGELRYKGLSFLEAVVAVKEATLTLCNQAKVPEKFWDNTHPDYSTSPFHGPTLSGVGDGAIEELKSIPELVSFGLQIATEPEEAKGLWNQIKSLTPAKVKKMLLGAASDKLAKYTAGGNVMKHEAGKDGVQLAMMFFTGGAKKIKDGLDMMDDVAEGVGKKLDDLGEETAENLRKNIATDAKETYLKAIKNNDYTKEQLEGIAEEIKDATTPTNDEWWRIFKVGKDYGKNITDKYVKTLDDGYYTKAADAFGIDKADLKGMAHIDELQINIGNGNFAVADNVWSKRVGQSNTFEVYINETKLSSVTLPSKRQTELFDAAGSSTNITSRSIDPLKAAVIPKDAKIIIKGIIKTNGNGSLSDFYNITKIEL